jgi:hypothetical protein
LNLQNVVRHSKLGKVRKVKARELEFRFAFGAGASLLAGCVTLRFGPRAGGLFLASRPSSRPA